MHHKAILSRGKSISYPNPNRLPDRRHRLLAGWREDVGESRAPRKVLDQDETAADGFIDQIALHERMASIAVGRGVGGMKILGCVAIARNS